MLQRINVSKVVAPQQPAESVPFVQYLHRGAYYRFYIGGKITKRHTFSAEEYPINHPDVPDHLTTISDQLVRSEEQMRSYIRRPRKMPQSRGLRSFR